MIVSFSVNTMSIAFSLCAHFVFFLDSTLIALCHSSTLLMHFHRMHINILCCSVMRCEFFPYSAYSDEVKRRKKVTSTRRKSEKLKKEEAMNMQTRKTKSIVNLFYLVEIVCVFLLYSLYAMSKSHNQIA